MISEETINLSNTLHNLFDWSIDCSSILDEVRDRPFKEYIAWKIPFPIEQLNMDGNNRAIRGYCVERLLTKLKLVARELKKDHEELPLCRVYCILTEPNLFGSEVGAVFSEEKWNSLLFRDVKSSTYCEQTKVTDGSLISTFGVCAPEGMSTIYLSHLIEDLDEDISFKGGFHAVWLDLP